jgi:DNA-binding ferritin-like protein (Dps family)
MLYWLKLRRIRIREQKKLDEVNLKVFKEIIKYIKNSNLQYIEKEEALHQIMDIILQAQAEQKSAEVIIGDYEAFCKSIIEEYTKDKSTVYTVLHHFQRASLNVLFFLVIGVIFTKVFYPKTDTGISANMLIFIMGISFILMPFENDSKKKKWAAVIYFVAMIFAVSYITETQHGAIIDDIVIKNTNIILLGFSLIVAVVEIYKRICDKRKHRNI